MEIVRLEDVCYSGSSNISQKDVMMLDGIYPVYGASGFIKNINFYKCEKPYIAIVKDGSGVGRTMILPEKSSVIGTMQYIFPRDNIDIRYLYYAITSMNLSKYCMGIAIPHIYFKDYKKEILNLPSISEQVDIANKLDLMQKIIELKMLQIKDLDSLIKSQFVEMFGDPIVNSKKIKKEKLGDICKIYRGASPRPINKYLNGTIPWIKIGDATNGDNIYLNNTKEKVTEEGAKKSRLVKKGSLIFANCGVSLGFARIINFDGCIHDGWLAFEDFEDVLNPIFLLQSLNFCTEHFRNIAPDGTQPNLNTTIMKEYEQIIPDMDEQNKYVDFIKQIDKQKVEIQKSLDEVQKLQESLMNEYFGG